jgi:hypothetical protein
MYTIDIVLCVLASVSCLGSYIIGKRIEEIRQQNRIHATVENPLNEAEYEEVEMRETNDNQHRTTDDVF